ncbi:MAG: sugar phosphate nucleotidyltransferase [Patescibacteria group bacterium]|nr:sugar phosphate nucleotidyltransferase [Patescibacteria group bacterium]MCL5095132.1 sugar phosphate nucleotidyltransferase [Patescibacteria group bacterium]
MKAVIFAGGVGTRLWPLSRKSYPKQFEKVIGEKSTLQLAVDRLFPDFGWKDIYISTGSDYIKLVQQQLPKLPRENIIGEPQMRDVGPAVGLATAILAKESPDTPMVILWSDHLVKKEEFFRKILKTAEKRIIKNPQKIIFIGQKPRFASQNLGWIEHGVRIDKEDDVEIYKFKSFRYRPELDLAEKYFRSGRHSWNLGYFVTTPRFLWNQYKNSVPKMFHDLSLIQTAWGTAEFKTILNKIYPQIEKISFDNAILEKLDPKTALVISENLEWSDVGAWEALKEALQTSTEQNVTSGKVLLKDCRDCLVYNYTNQLVTTIDLDGHLVINTNDVVLVCHKNSVPKIKKLVEEISGTENSHLT